MIRLFALIAMFALTACSTVGGVASMPTNMARGGSDGRATFMSIPVQPWMCDPTIDGYCPLEAKLPIGQQT